MPQISNDVLSSLLPKEDLHPKIWPQKKLDKSVRNKLIKIAIDFAKDVGIESNEIEDIIFTGSLANYNWSKYSDIDLHIMVDYDKFLGRPEFIENYFKAQKNLWNNQHNIKIFGHDVEVYIQDIKESHYASGIYSVLGDEWLVDPKPIEVKTFDKNLIRNKVKKIIFIIDEIKKEKNSKEIENMTSLLKTSENEKSGFRKRRRIFC